jgi:hypothetical protein
VTLITSITGIFNLSIHIFVLVVVVVDQPVSGVNRNPLDFDAHLRATASELATKSFLLAMKEKHPVVLGKRLHEVLGVCQSPAVTDASNA